MTLYLISYIAIMLVLFVILSLELIKLYRNLNSLNENIKRFNKRKDYDN